MKGIIFALLLCINFSCYAHEDTFKKQWRITTPRPYNEIGIDTLQECIINYERDMAYVYSDFSERKLAGLCLRAFYAWSKRYTNNESLKLDVLELGRGFSVDHPFSGWAYEIDEDEEDEDGNFIDERERDRANRYIDEFSFNVISDNECLEHKVVGKDTAIANVSIYPFGLFSSITIKIEALIPEPNKQDIFIKKEFWYIFRLKLKLGPGGIDFWNKFLIKNLERNPYFIVNSDCFVNLEELYFDFDWELYSIQLVKDEIIDCNIKTKPITFKDLFKDSSR